MSTALLVSFVVGLVRVWRVPFVRDRVFGWVTKAPQWAQWAFPLVVAMLTTLADGLVSGVPPELLAAQVAERGGEIGVLAIGVWHITKRLVRCIPVLWRFIKNRGAAVSCLALLGVLGYGNAGCALFRSAKFWDMQEALCTAALAASPEVQAKAQRTGKPAKVIAEILCGFADVVEPFVRAEIAAQEGRRLSASPKVEALRIAREKGLL